MSSSSKPGCPGPKPWGVLVLGLHCAVAGLAPLSTATAGEGTAPLALSVQAEDLDPFLNTRTNRIELSLDDILRRARKVNPSIQSRDLQRRIAVESVTYAEGAFQSQVDVELSKSGSRQKNTPEEALLRSGLGIYDTQSSDLSVTLSKLLPSGATVQAGYSLSEFDSNVSQQRRGFAQDDYRSIYNLSITQPLLRGGGLAINRNPVEVARADVDIAADDRARTAVSIFADAVAAYYDLALAEEKLALWLDGQKITTDLLSDAKALQRTGRMTATEVLDVESNALRYQAAVSDAHQTLNSARNRLAVLLMINSADARRLVAIDGLPGMTLPTMDREQSLALAREHRPDYRMQRRQFEREELKETYARDQDLPQLDLVVSYGTDNLETTAGTSAADYEEALDFPSWSIGLQASFTLGEDMQTSAELRTAQLRKLDALVNLRALETAMVTDIDTSISAIESSHERWRVLERTVEIEEVQLDSERERMTAGRSNVRTLLARKERLMNARQAALDQKAVLAKALVSLDVAQGTLKVPDAP